MKMKPIASLVILMACSISACTQVAITNVPSHSSIRQNGIELTPKQVNNGTYIYTLADAPFALLVPSMDSKGNRYRVDSTQVRICARTDSNDFKEIVAGANVQDTCLNSGWGLYNSPNQAMSGMDLLVGSWNTVVEGFNVSESRYNTINFRRILNYKRSMGCKPNNPTCTHISNISPGTKLYLVVFADMNGNNVIDAGEFTLIELDLH